MTRQDCLRSIAATIADYRTGELPQPDAEHVDRWVRQFDLSVQEPMLAEMDHVLKQCYLSQAHFLAGLRDLVLRKRLAGSPLWAQLQAICQFIVSMVRGQSAAARMCPRHWQHVQLLEIQRHGASQREMVRLLNQVLQQEFGTRVGPGDPRRGVFLYLDDILFTGNRIIIDVQEWLRSIAPPHAELIVVVLACYRRGLLYTHRAILRAAAETKKALRVHWIRFSEFEDRHWAADARDGFHPTCIPDHPLARAYVAGLDDAGWLPRLRRAGSGTPSRIFSNESARHLLEQQFLLAGLKIRSFYRNPQKVLRPLGYHVLNGLGFGAPLVTYRNCPNNCPLAWWWDTAGIPGTHARGHWYPLFPRKV